MSKKVNHDKQVEILSAIAKYGVKPYMDRVGYVRNFAVRISKGYNDRYRKYGYIYDSGGYRINTDEVSIRRCVWYIDLKTCAN